MTESDRPARRRGAGRETRPGTGGADAGTGKAGARNRAGETRKSRAANDPDEERTRAELREEISELEKQLDAYETREQQVIDRYERLLAKQRRQQAERRGDDRSSRPASLTDQLQQTKRRLLRTTRQLGQTKQRLLRTFGLR